MTITPASPCHAAQIARLIMLAMNHDCCRFLAGPRHTLDDFFHMMQALVLMPDSQYSWRNAIVALDDEASPSAALEQAPVAGVVVGYDGACLHQLRRRFQEAALEHLQMDYSHMDDETCAGEFYIDSLAVSPRYRRRGIASSLLRAMIGRASALRLPAALLVDKGNPDAERLYTSLGFRHHGDAVWGSHPMKHLVHEGGA